MKRVCKECGKPFETNHSKKVFCTWECQRAFAKVRAREYARNYQREYKMKKKCKFCGQEFTGGRGKLYCSTECKSKALIRQNREKKGNYGAELQRIAAEARKAGMSYGQYVAAMEGGRT